MVTRPGRMPGARAEGGSKEPAAPEGGSGGDSAGRLLVPRQWLHGALPQTPLPLAWPAPPPVLSHPRAAKHESSGLS